MEMKKRGIRNARIFKGKKENGYLNFHILEPIPISLQEIRNGNFLETAFVHISSRQAEAILVTQYLFLDPREKMQ